MYMLYFCTGNRGHVFRIQQKNAGIIGWVNLHHNDSVWMVPGTYMED